MRPLIISQHTSYYLKSHNFDLQNYVGDFSAGPTTQMDMSEDCQITKEKNVCTV